MDEDPRKLFPTGKKIPPTKSVIKIFDLTKEEEKKEFNETYAKILNQDYFLVHMKYGGEQDGIPTKVFLHYVIPGGVSNAEIIKDFYETSNIKKILEEEEKIKVQKADIPIVEI